MSKLSPELLEMTELFGEDGVKEIMDAYRKSLTEFENFLNTPNLKPEEIKGQAHKMKSPSRSVGENEMATFCEALEKASALTSEARDQGLSLVRIGTEKFNSYF